MVVHDLHIVSIAVSPLKTYAILVVDPNRVLTLTGALKVLKPVARWNSQIIQSCGGMNHVKFAPRHILDRLPLPDPFVVEEPRSILRFERPNHTEII